MADRKLGCLSIFLFVALCASVFVNFVLMIAALRGFGGMAHQEERPPRFREISVQPGARTRTDRIAVIMRRGLISSSIPRTAGAPMADEMRARLAQARE